MGLSEITKAVSFLKSKIDNKKPDIALILGSGIGFLADALTNSKSINYTDIPHFPVSTVSGHSGRLVFGTLEGKEVMAMQGRFHYYEGYTMQKIALPIRIMKSLGIKKLIVTNAAGGVNRDFKPGALMLINDHINFSFCNPLIGRNEDEFGSRFPDTQNAYDPSMRNIALDVAKKSHIKLHQGVYFFNTGPCYETPAEVRMAGILGADAVGMSTFPEVLTATHTGIRVLGISLISNLAAGIAQHSLSHEEVMETAELVKDKLSILVRGIVKRV